jgi:hypothetical protein
MPLTTIRGPLKDFLDSERQFIEESKALANAKKAHARRNNPSYKLCLFRDQADLLLDKTDLCFQQPYLSSALRGWIGRSRFQKQLRIKGYAEKAAIVASADYEKAMSFLKCSPRCNPKQKLFPCGRTDYCPTCHWARIGDAIFQEYKAAYVKAKHWYAITVSFVWHDGRLKLVTRKDRKCREQDSLRDEPFADAPRLEPLAFGEAAQIRVCGKTPFWLLRVLQQMGIVCGALAALDCHVSFFPIKAPRHYLSVGDGLIIHAHILANTAEPLDWDACLAIYRALLDHSRDQGIRLQPDLHISPLRSQREFLAWLRYVVKPLVFEKFYAEGAVACSDRPEHFNLHFDQVVFQGLADAYASVISPRRYGNMQFRAMKKSYIGDYQFKKRIGDTKFRALRLRYREPDLGPLTRKELAQFLYERERRRQRGRQVRRWRKEKEANSRPGRAQGEAAQAGGASQAEAFTAEEYQNDQV